MVVRIICGCLLARIREHNKAGCGGKISLTWGYHCTVAARQCGLAGTSTSRHGVRTSIEEEKRYEGLSNPLGGDGTRGKEVTDERTKFWDSVVQDVQLEHLITQLQEDEG